MKAKVAQLGGPPPLGLHLILGANAPAKLANMISAIQAGTIAPVEIICHKPPHPKSRCYADGLREVSMLLIQARTAHGWSFLANS